VTQSLDSSPLPTSELADDALPEGDPDAIVRRAPFSENPQVGVRGQRAQQRILEAALQAFGELGYHPCGIGQIAEVASCSRASIYQYFASKEDVFRHLAGQVARQLSASAEALEPITADAAGWDSIHAWLERHAATYRRYEPVFNAYAAAAETDATLAGGSARIEERLVATVRSKVEGTTLRREHLDDVIGLLMNLTTRAPRVSDVLRTAVPSTSLRGELVRHATVDVIHRTLFGLDRAVNVQPPSKRKPATPKRLDAALRAGMEGEPDHADLTSAGRRTLATLLDSAHAVLVSRGYHATRVDDITTAAGMSHGAFYRYFPNKDQVVRTLAMRAMGRIGAAFASMPSAIGDDGKQLRAWLGQYGSSYAQEAMMIRVWVDATASDPLLSLESASALDWGRQRLVRFLEPRGFGDVDTDALLAVVLLDTMGDQAQTPRRIEAAALVVERGFLGLL
jgi:AcrR family transcriptional regulator